MCWRQRCGRRGCRVCKRTPKNYDLLKIRENLEKICENIHKTPENLCKAPENTGINGAQCYLILKNWRSACVASHEELSFWRSSQKKVIMICVGRNIRTNSCPETFSGKFREIRAKSFRIPNNFPAPTPMAREMPGEVLVTTRCWRN